MAPTSSPSPFRIAVVGCGAVSRASLLPVLAGHPDVQVVALVDRDVGRARELAQTYGVLRVESDVSAISRGDADGVVLATPPGHHAAAAIQLAGLGFHMFVEKPMATTYSDAGQMVRAAADAGVALSVGMFRRLLPGARLMRSLLEDGLLGAPTGIDIEEGGEYGWQLATLAGLTRAAGGGGVLIDLGTHVIDQLLFMTPGEACVTRYIDNARGGIETDCELQLELDTRWGRLPARLELSRTRELRNSVRITCERGVLELPRSEFSRVFVEPDQHTPTDPVSGRRRRTSIAASWQDEPTLVGYEAFRFEFDDWLAATRSGTSSMLSGASALPVVQIIETAYQTRASRSEPWTERRVWGAGTGNASPSTVVPRRVLVTGAGGFLGCRLTEVLHEQAGWAVRAMVRRPASAARLARLPVEIVLGDVTSAQDLEAALQGCEAVVHCAVGTTWPPRTAFEVTVNGTRAVADAALRAGVRRFVHVSSMAVHGDHPPELLDETLPFQPGVGYSYTRAKCLAEQAVSEAHGRGLPAITVRPTRIYGPFSKTFTVRPLRALSRNALVLAGDADSPANMVYVDNVVHAILRALEAPSDINGEAFLISDPDQLSWKDFYMFFANASGGTVATAAYPVRDGKRPLGLARRWTDGLSAVMSSGELRSFGKKILATDPLGTWPRRWIEGSPALERRLQRALGVDQAVVYRRPSPAVAETVEFRIDPTVISLAKATGQLGYAPPVPTAEAMQLTLEWARYARLL
jgi:predicted dehydrogenase/nucleoside-diphosphate-sugar epimerase